MVAVRNGSSHDDLILKVLLPVLICAPILRIDIQVDRSGVQIPGSIMYTTELAPILSKYFPELTTGAPGEGAFIVNAGDTGSFA